VNVHPTKAEVRFQENSLVYSLVRSAVKTRLLRENLIPRLTVPVGQDPESGVRSQGTGDRRQETSGAGVFPSPRADLAHRTVAPWEMPPIQRSEVRGQRSDEDSGAVPDPASDHRFPNTEQFPSRQESPEPIPTAPESPSDVPPPDLKSLL